MADPKEAAAYIAGLVKRAKAAQQKIEFATQVSLTAILTPQFSVC